MLRDCTAGRLAHLPWRAVPGVQLLANFENGKLLLHRSLERFIVKAIAYAAHGGDESLVPKFLAHVSEMDIHHARLAKIFTAPNFFEQLFARKYPSAIFGQRA